MAGLRDNHATEAITAETEADRLEAFADLAGHVSDGITEAIADLEVAERYTAAPGAIVMAVKVRSALLEAAQLLEALRTIEAQNG